MKKKYWTEIEEELVKQIIKSKTKKVKEESFNKLYPKLYHMADAILHRYFGHNLHDLHDPNDNVVDVIGKVAYVLHKFDIDKGTAFSFCQTVIKNEFSEYFVVRSKHNSKYIATDFSAYHTDDHDEDRIINKHLIEPEFDIEFVEQPLKTGVINKLRILQEDLYKHKNTTGATICGAVIEYFNITDSEFVNNYSLSCYLQTHLPFSVNRCYYFFYKSEVKFPLIRERYLIKNFGEDIFSKSKVEVDQICLTYLKNKNAKSKKEKTYEVRKYKNLNR